VDAPLPSLYRIACCRPRKWKLAPLRGGSCSRSAHNHPPLYRQEAAPAFAPLVPVKEWTRDYSVHEKGHRHSSPSDNYLMLSVQAQRDGKEVMCLGRSSSNHTVTSCLILRTFLGSSFCIFIMCLYTEYALGSNVKPQNRLGFRIKCKITLLTVRKVLSVPSELAHNDKNVVILERMQLARLILDYNDNRLPWYTECSTVSHAPQVIPLTLTFTLVPTSAWAALRYRIIGTWSLYGEDASLIISIFCLDRRIA